MTENDSPWPIARLAAEIQAALSGRFTDEHPLAVSEALLEHARRRMIVSGMSARRADRWIEAFGEDHAERDLRKGVR